MGTPSWVGGAVNVQTQPAHAHMLNMCWVATTPVGYNKQQLNRVYQQQKFEFLFFSMSADFLAIEKKGEIIFFLVFLRDCN